MRVLFIYSLQKSVTQEKPLLGQEGIYFGISYISSVLKLSGHLTDLVIIDRKYKERNIKVLRSAINRFNPGLMCFTSVHSEFEFITAIASRIKKLFPNILFMLGGVHVTLNPSETLLDIFNCICIGEGEYPALEYVNCIEKKESPKGVQNLWLKEEGKLYKNEVRKFIEDLDQLPFSDRDIWQRWILEPQTRLTVMLGRGCPYNCTYCSNHSLSKIATGEYVRLRSPENILSEIESLYQRFPKVDEYFLEVETIGCNMAWLSELCLKLHGFNSSRSDKLKFGTNLRIFPGMDFEAVFQNLEFANFDSVIIGLESGNERVRKEVLNRVYSNENILTAVEIARNHDLKVGIFNMVGLPKETKKDFMDTLKMNQVIKPDWHSTSIFFPYQGTRLYEITKEMNLLPQKLNTKDERQKSVLDLPGFSRREIQKSFDSFNFNVYQANENKNVLKIFVYFIMKYIGHNRLANLKLTVIRVLYFLKLYDFAKRIKLLGVFQKA
jgi:anaerobic magnesium-protoporphyrin IX monomethyl ester cyclase